MLVNLVKDNAEDALIAFIERHAKRPKNLFFLEFRASLLTAGVHNPETFLSFTKHILSPLGAHIFFMANGDIITAWSAQPKKIKDELCACLLREYKSQMGAYEEESFFKYYDFHLDAEDLRLDCVKRAKDAMVEEMDTMEVAFVERTYKSLNQHLRNVLAKKIKTRADRKKPHVLIVEDQDFSIKLLSRILEDDYVQHIAHDAAKAILTFCLNAPDIVILDIGLPDRSGHSLAKLFKRLDKNVHIIMISGNQSYKDVALAKRNGVEGYIVKPYKKDTVLGVLSKLRFEEGKNA